MHPGRGHCLSSGVKNTFSSQDIHSCHVHAPMELSIHPIHASCKPPSIMSLAAPLHDGLWPLSPLALSGLICTQIYKSLSPSFLISDAYAMEEADPTKVLQSANVLQSGMLLEWEDGLFQHILPVPPLLIWCRSSNGWLWRGSFHNPASSSVLTSQLSTPVAHLVEKV